VEIARFVEVLRHALPRVPPESFAPAAGLGDRVAELRAEYARRRRVIVPGLLEERLARAVARTLPDRAWNLACSTRVRQPDGKYQWQNYWSAVRPSAHCAAGCWALCGFGTSLLGGPLCELVRAITDNPRLMNRLGPRGTPMMVAQAYGKGCYLEPHDDQVVDGGDRRAVAFVWHASERWERPFGGLLGFVTAEPEQWVPRFNDLHVFEVGIHNRHEVTLVTEDAVRYSLSGWWYEPGPRRFTPERARV
jgi:2OG-Fe(II) oxygenase superfamily